MVDRFWNLQTVLSCNLSYQISDEICWSCTIGLHKLAYVTMGYRAQFFIFLSLGIILTFTFWVSTYNNKIQESDEPDTGDRDVRFEAGWSFCSCKRSPLSVKNQTTFHWCSEESTMRGFNQSIIAYSLYGQHKNGTGIKSKYFSAVNLIPQQARQFYPGTVSILWFI